MIVWCLLAFDLDGLRLFLAACLSHSVHLWDDDKHTLLGLESCACLPFQFMLSKSRAYSRVSAPGQIVMSFCKSTSTASTTTTQAVFRVRYYCMTMSGARPSSCDGHLTFIVALVVPTTQNPYVHIPPCFCHDTGSSSQHNIDPHMQHAFELTPC